MRVIRIHWEKAASLSCFIQPLFGIGELSVSLPRSRALPERRNFPRTLALVLFVCLHSYSGSISLCHYLTTRF